MPEPFKNFFNIPLVEKMAALFSAADPSFDPKRFIALATKDFEALELKQRSNQIRDAMVATLPNNIDAAGPILTHTLGAEAPIDGGTTQEGIDGLSGFAIMPMADFVAEIGIGDLDKSFAILEELTKRFSAEFAVRPFIMLIQTRRWNILPIGRRVKTHMYVAWHQKGAAHCCHGDCAYISSPRIQHQFCPY